jgi:hypothetical protein
MHISNHRANVENSARTSAKKIDTKSTSSRTNEKSGVENKKLIQMKK